MVHAVKSTRHAKKQCDKMKGDEKMENEIDRVEFVTNYYDGEQYKLIQTPNGEKYVLDSGEVKNENEQKSRK